MLNICIRTSGRPLGFARLLYSIRYQTDQKYRLHITVDDPMTEQYVRQSGAMQMGYHPTNLIRTTRLTRLNPDHNPYNLYMNTLLGSCQSDWIIFRDDDTIFPAPDTLENMKLALTDPDQMYIFQVHLKEPDNKIIPGPTWGKQFAFGDLDTACLAVHTKYNHAAVWKPIRGGDFHYANDMMTFLGHDKVSWSKQVVCVIDKAGFGDRKDIQV
jgi:hypothetical protein